jgi:hypothetical protein
MSVSFRPLIGLYEQGIRGTPLILILGSLTPRALQLLDGKRFLLPATDKGIHGLKNTGSTYSMVIFIVWSRITLE